MTNRRQKKSVNSSQPPRRSLGRAREGAVFPAPPPVAELPDDYAAVLRELKECIGIERLRTVMSANAEMVLLYWDVGSVILQRQQSEGWGARVIDRLSADLRKAFPDMRGLSPRNLKYMRAFASAWPERRIVQEVLAQITWYQNIALLEKLTGSEERLWYARKTLEHGWSHNILGVAQWETKLTRSLPKELATSLPSIEQIEAELSREETR